MILMRGTKSIPVLIDSGVRVSLTPDKELIHGFEPFNEVSIDFHGGSTHLRGICYLIVDFDGFYVKTKVYYTPEATETYITKYYLLEAGCNFHIISREPVVKELVFKIHSTPLKTYHKVHNLPPSALKSPSPSIKICSIHIHTRFGHVNARYHLDYVNNETITSVSKSHLAELNGFFVDYDCHDCLQGKATRAYAIEGSKDTYSTTVFFSMVYSDACLITRSRFKDRLHYFVSFKCSVTHQ